MSGVLDGLSAEDSAKAFDAIRKIKTGTGKERTDALETIFNLGKEDKAKLSLCQVSTGLPDALLQTLRLTNDSYATSWAVSCIGRLSASVRQNKEYLASPASGMVPELVRLLAQSNCKDNCYVFFGNCILSPVTVSYLLSESLGLIDAAKHDIQTNPDYKFPYTLLANAVTIMDNSHCAYFARMRIHEMIVNRIVQAGPDPTKWPDRNTGCVYRSMGFVTSFSTLPDGRKAIRELQKKDFFLEFLKTKEKERMQASIIMANLYGRDEGDTTTKSLLQTYPDLLQLLVNLLAAILNYNSDSKEVKDYKAMGLAFGVTKMRDASSTLRCLSISDGNKAVMLRHPSLLNFVMQGIQLFINNSDECAAVYQGFQSYAGGGGKDFESIENFMDLLLQLSFYYEDDAQLQREFNKPEYQLVYKLKTLLNLPSERQLPFEARQHALQLVRRLDPSSKLTTSVSNVTQQLKNLTTNLVPSATVSNLGLLPASSIPQHIMLSYAWGANKQHVVELGNRLRALGYDVWRDEEGSSLVGPMSGDIVETMAEAIQHSFMVVICVSREYKDSSNCRAEAKFSRSRQQSHKLKIAYVMMDQNYTTVSKPNVVDGWLGFMVGTELWYPLWSLSQAESCARGIADIAKGNAVLATNQALLNGGGLPVPAPVAPTYSTKSSDDSFKSTSTPAPNTPPPASSAPSGGKDFVAAWDCLTDPKKALDPVKLQEVLDEFGLSTPDEMQYLDVEQSQRLAALLKPIPQKKFKSSVGI
eukprot:gene9077-9831_t